MDQFPFLTLSQPFHQVFSVMQDNIGPFQLSYKGEKNFQRFKKTSEWNYQEIARYVVLIDFNKTKMENRNHRDLWSLYKQMASRITTRNYVQCKLFHQKMLKKYKTLKDIVFHLLDSSSEVEHRVADLKAMHMKSERSRLTAKEGQENEDSLLTADSYIFELEVEQKNMVEMCLEEQNRQNLLQDAQKRLHFFSTKLKALRL